MRRKTKRRMKTRQAVCCCSRRRLAGGRATAGARGRCRRCRAGADRTGGSCQTASAAVRCPACARAAPSSQCPDQCTPRLHVMNTRACTCIQGLVKGAQWRVRTCLALLVMALEQQGKQTRKASTHARARASVCARMRRTKVCCGDEDGAGAGEGVEHERAPRNARGIDHKEGQLRVLFIAHRNKHNKNANASQKKGRTSD
jgi:hypothetical protein